MRKVRQSSLKISTRTVRSTDLLYDTARQALHRATHMVRNGYDRAKVVPVLCRDGSLCGFYVVARAQG